MTGEDPGHTLLGVFRDVEKANRECEKFLRCTEEPWRDEVEYDKDGCLRCEIKSVHLYIETKRRKLMRGGEQFQNVRPW